MESDCAYSAKKSEILTIVLDSVSLIHSVYLNPVSRGNSGWPVEVIVDGPVDVKNVTDALITGPYGKCVYESDNDVCDHQVW